MANDREKGPAPAGQDEQQSVLDRIKSSLGGAEANTERTLDGKCDHCGTTEGSLIESKDDDWKLCREDFNDPEVLEKYV